MVRCDNCNAVATEAHPYCPSCGAPTGIALVPGQGQVIDGSPALPMHAHHAMAARGLGQIFGILPSIAFLTLVVDMMLFGGEVLSLGTILPISIAAGAVLGIITYKAQIKWYGDDKESALIKGLILAFLTAIPTPIPAALYLPAGLVGFVHRLRKK